MVLVSRQIYDFNLQTFKGLLYWTHASEVLIDLHKSQVFEVICSQNWKMKIFKFRVEDFTYVRWNFGGTSIKDYLFSTFDQQIQHAFEMTLDFKKLLDEKLNNQWFKSPKSSRSQILVIRDYQTPHKGVIGLNIWSKRNLFCR